MIVLDTDHLSVLQFHNSRSAIGLRERLTEFEDAENHVVTTIVSYEEQMRSWLSQIGRRSNVAEQVPFYDRLLRFVEFYADWELLPLNNDAAQHFGRLRKEKIRISTTDLKIASIVLAHDATLFSRNVADFRQVPGLKCETLIED